MLRPGRRAVALVAPTSLCCGSLSNSDNRRLHCFSPSLTCYHHAPARASSIMAAEIFSADWHRNHLDVSASILIFGAIERDRIIKLQSAQFPKLRVDNGTHLAGVEDFEVAEATYRAAVKRWHDRTPR